MSDKFKVLFCYPNRKWNKKQYDKLINDICKIYHLIVLKCCHNPKAFYLILTGDNYTSSLDNLLNSYFDISFFKENDLLPYSEIVKIN